MRQTVPQVSHGTLFVTRKGSVFRFRRRLPVAVGGEVVVSLRTRNYREAEHRAGLLGVAFADALARARPMMTTAADRPLVAQIVRDYLREALEEDARVRLGAPPGRPLYGRSPDAEDGDGGEGDDAAAHDIAVARERLAEARGALASRDTHSVADRAAELAQRHALPPEDRRPLALGLLEANVRFYEEAHRRSTGHAALWLPAPAPAGAEAVGAAHGAPVPPPPHAVASPANPLASALVEPFFKRRAEIDASSHHDMSQDRTSLRLFLEVAGDRPVSDYARADVTAFLDTLRRMPKTYGKGRKDRGRAVAEIIAEADKMGAARLADKTVKRHLTALTQFLRYGVDAGHLTVAQHTELTGKHRFRETRGAREQRDAWTPEELKALFASPVWAGSDRHVRSRPGPHILRDAKFWLPILALYHGARLEELADLRGGDLFADDCDGARTWALRITEGEDADGEERRRLKTEQARRVVPLHPEVLRLGFLAYARSTAPNPADPLFPDLEPQGPDGKRGPRFTRFFGNYRKVLGLYREGVGMHAFRHTAITRLTDAITDAQQERHRDFLMGHASGGSEGRRRYDKGPGLKALAETLALLRFPEIDLRHLHQHAAEVGSPTQP